MSDEATPKELLNPDGTKKSALEINNMTLALLVENQEKMFARIVELERRISILESTHCYDTTRH